MRALCSRAPLAHAVLGAADKTLLPKALLGGDMAAVVKVEVVEGSNLIVADKGGEQAAHASPSWGPQTHTQNTLCLFCRVASPLFAHQAAGGDALPVTVHKQALRRVCAPAAVLSSGTSDPYVKGFLGRSKFTTQVSA